MKCIKRYAAFLLFIATISCNTIDDGSYVEPITLYEKTEGDWALMNLKMTDEYAKANGLSPVDQNISTLFHFDDFQLHLNVDENNIATTYEITGDVPHLFPLYGYWGLSKDFQSTTSEPVKIYLYSDAQKTQIAEELQLTSVPGSNGEMEVKLVRTNNGTPFVSYTFSLNTIN